MSLPDNRTEMDILDLYLTDEFYDLIVLETNRYAKQYFKENTGLPKYSRARQDLDKAELQVFFALTLLSGIIQKPHMRMYWSTNPLLQGSMFAFSMSRDRYLNILKFMHFANNRDFDPSDPKKERDFLKFVM